MNSPQHHCAPHAMHSSGHVAPINLGLPLHTPQPAPGNNPFLAPFAPAPAPAPAFAPAPVVHNDPFLGPPAFAPVVYGGQQYNHLPAALAQQLAAMPPAPVHRGRGRGQGRGQGPQAHPHPNVVPPAIFPPAQGNAPAPAAMVC